MFGINELRQNIEGVLLPRRRTKVRREAKFVYNKKARFSITKLLLL